MPVIDEAADPAPARPAGPLIVHVVRQFRPGRGGLEDVVTNLSQVLVRRGFRVRVVTLDRLFTARDTILPAREDFDGIEIVRIPWRGPSRYPIAPAVFRHLADADLIHVHAIDFFFDALSIFRLLHRKPLVATTHGGFFHTPDHALIKKVWFSTLTRLSARGYGRIVGCSRSDMTLFQPVAGKRLTLIENGADVGKFAGRSSPVPAKHVVTIGRFSSNKRLDRLIAVMRVLVERDPHWRLDIAGVPGDLSLADVEGLVAANGLGGHVSVHCDLENAAIADILDGVSLFASASDYEGFGLVALEAMSAGLLPVLNGNDAFMALAAQCPSIAITDFSDPVPAADALAESHARLMRDEGLRARLQADVAGWSWETVAERYIDVYRDVAGWTGRLPVSGQSFQVV